MLTCRSISTQLWAQVRGRLIYYFSRRHGFQNAEDLAHNTLVAVWIREDFEFEKEEDFVKVCYGFARNVAQDALRARKRHEYSELDPETAEKASSVKGLRGAEMKAFLDEVMRTGKAELEAEDWELIKSTINPDAEAGPVPTNLRVRLHRIRKRLAKLTGWEKFEV